jgi:methyl-accepting chemotaxis protein
MANQLFPPGSPLNLFKRSRLPPAERSLQDEITRSIVVVFVLITGLVASVVGLASLYGAVLDLERRASFIARALTTVELSAAARLEDRRLIESQLSALLALDEELVDVIVLRDDGEPITGIGRRGPLGDELASRVRARPSFIEVREEVELIDRDSDDDVEDLYEAVEREANEGAVGAPVAKLSPRVRITLTAFPRFRDAMLSLVVTSLLLCLATLTALRGTARRAFRSLTPAFEAAHQMSLGDFTGQHTAEYRELALLFEAFAEIAASLSTMLDDTRRLGSAVAEVVARIRSETEVLLADTARQQESSAIAESAIGTMDTSAKETEATLRALITHVDRSSVETSSIRAAMDTSAAALKSLLVEVERQSRSVRSLTAHADRFSRSADALDRRSTSAMGSAERLKGALDDIDKRVQEAAQLSGDALTGTQTGSTAVEAAMARVHQLAEVVEALGANVRGLIARVEAVTPVVDAIVDVTSQTEMLALNAGILAAQAGAEGRGFQVVVDELKALARRTSSLTGTVEGTVKSILDERGKTAEATERLRNIVQASLVETGRATSSLATIRESSLAAQEISSSLADIVRARVRDADGAIVDLKELASVGRAVGDTAKDLVNEASVLVDLAARIEETTASVEDTARTQSIVTRRVSDALQDVARLVGAVSDQQVAERGDAARVRVAMIDIKRAADGALARADAFAEVVGRLESETAGLESALARFRTVR